MVLISLHSSQMQCRWRSHGIRHSRCCMGADNLHHSYSYQDAIKSPSCTASPGNFRELDQAETRDFRGILPLLDKTSIQLTLAFPRNQESPSSPLRIRDPS